MRPNGYVGRFAPSPTGPLHFGSLVAAAGSYLYARQAHGQWLVRIEDIDPPREVRGASADILRTLERFGFEWDGAVRYQSTRIEHYRACLARLGHLTYRCTCSRKQIAALATPGNRYPGTCRDKYTRSGGTVRVRCDALPIFTDALRGQVVPPPGADDFVLWRKDDLPSYQWAVTLDDADQGVTHVVRGADLLETTPRQIFLLHQLNEPLPQFAHLPLVVTADGHKLSKQTGANALPSGHTGNTLCAALAALGLAIPAALSAESCTAIWRYAVRHWQPNTLKDIKTIPFVAESM